VTIRAKRKGELAHAVDVNTDLKLDNVSLDESGNSGIRGHGRKVGNSVVDGDGSGESDTCPREKRDAGKQVISGCMRSFAGRGAGRRYPWRSWFPSCCRRS
jgi:hypothetical protein